MNYINKLEEENKQLKAAAEKAREDLMELIKHLNSPKFQDTETSINSYINIRDVSARVMPVITDLKIAQEA